MWYEVHSGRKVEMPFRDYLVCRTVDLILDYPLRKFNNKITDWFSGFWHDRVNKGKHETR